MKRIIFTALIAITGVLSSVADQRQSVVMGAAVGSGSHSIVVGEAAAGTIGATNGWHVTSGQLQGIAEVCDVSSVDNIMAPDNGYSVYPNPVRDVVNISRPDSSPATLTVTALNGASMFTATLTDQKSVINLLPLVPGAYILAINPENGSATFTLKIIKL